MTATLTSGFTVHFRECYSHGMERAFKQALSKAVQLKEVGGQVVIDSIQADALDQAIEAVLALMVEKITKDGQDVPYAPDWLTNLPEKDFETLKDHVQAVRSANESKKEKGKKNQ